MLGPHLYGVCSLWFLSSFHCFLPACPPGLTFEPQPRPSEALTAGTLETSQDGTRAPDAACLGHSDTKSVQVGVCSL